MPGRRPQVKGDGKSLDGPFPWQHVEHNNQRVQKVTNWKTSPETIKSDTRVCLLCNYRWWKQQKKKKSESWKLIWNSFIQCRAEKAKSVLKSLHAAPAATLLRNRVKYEQPAEREQQVLWEMRCGGVSRPSAQGHTGPAGWSSCPGPPAPPPSCLDVSGLPARETHTNYQ